MEKLIELLESEWTVVSVAPLTIALIAAVIWMVVRHVYKDRLDSAKELIELKDAKIADFQSKTKAQTPDEAADRIAKLEGRIEEVANQPAKWG